jgi:hypothetical protein
VAAYHLCVFTCREFFLVMANVFFSTSPVLCCALNLLVNTVFLILHNMPADAGCLKCLKMKHSVYPPSSSKFINHLASFLLCSGAHKAPCRPWCIPCGPLLFIMVLLPLSYYSPLLLLLCL